MPELSQKYLFALLLFPAILDFSLSVLVVLHNKTRLNVVFSVLCFAVGLWTIGISIFGLVDLPSAFFWNREFIIAAGFIPATFLHFVYLLRKANLKKRLLCAIYCPALVTMAVIIVWPQGFIKDIVQHDWGKESILGNLYLVYGIYFFIYTYCALYKLFVDMRRSQGIEKDRYKFILIGTSLPLLLGGYFNLLLILLGNYRFIWCGPYFTSVFALLIFYTIIKYRLMDIRVAISNAGIFLATYALVLGVPLFLGFKCDLWQFATFIMFALASTAPFIYSYFQKRAEETLLKEERRYQDVLLQTSDTLANKVSTDEISKSIVDIMDRTIRPKSAAFYLYDGKKFVLKDTVGDGAGYCSEIVATHPVAGYLRFVGVVHLGEFRQKSFNTATDRLDQEVIGFFRQHPATVAVPFKRLDAMVGILFLGEKVNASAYSDRDLVVLKDVAINGTLALVNAIHIARTTKTIEEEMHDHRLRDMGVIGASISHQVSNRLQIVINFLGLFARRFAPEKVSALSKEEILERFNSMIPLMPEIMDNAIKAAEISDALKTQGKLSKDAHAVALKRLVKMARAIAEAKHPGLKYEFIEEYDDSLTLWANESSMQDILFNLFDNSLDSIATKMKGADKPEGYVGCIKVAARPEGEMAIITVEDNGIGMRKADLEKAFVPHFTTKGTDKGTGLGLYIIQQFIRHSKGTISVDAKSNEWARFTISFPMAK